MKIRDLIRNVILSGMLLIPSIGIADDLTNLFLQEIGSKKISEDRLKAYGELFIESEKEEIRDRLERRIILRQLILLESLWEHTKPPQYINSILDKLYLMISKRTEGFLRITEEGKNLDDFLRQRNIVKDIIIQYDKRRGFNSSSTSATVNSLPDVFTTVERGKANFEFLSQLYQM